ncbi:MAG: Nif11-like leader peptide family natural product precursor [Mogibacterium sp.]|nr:Nif11-like leader peptide family natural product precursor [Oscillospiraceae bacterium]MBR7088319.1 Nif11-like leader peptide family natural product precursor [Mogibacterium sp.]
MSTMSNEQLTEIFSDEAFVKELLAADDVKAVQQMLEGKGLSLTEAEITAVQERLENYNDGELSEDDLEDVAGGSVGSVVKGVVGTIVIAAPFVFAVKDHFDLRW